MHAAKDAKQDVRMDMTNNSPSPPAPDPLFSNTHPQR